MTVKILRGDCRQVLRSLCDCGAAKNRQSPRCRACYLSGHARPDNYVTHACAKCGEAFTVHRSQLARGQGRYCSRACARSGSPTRRRAPVLGACHQCSTPLERYPSEQRKRVGTLWFCGAACWHEHNRGENHAGWAGGQHDRMNPLARAWRAAVLRRDHRLCRLCHSGAPLEVHHILPFATHEAVRWETQNGLTLCVTCHRRITGNELIVAEVLAFIAEAPMLLIDLDERNVPMAEKRIEADKWNAAKRTPSLFEEAASA